MSFVNVQLTYDITSVYCELWQFPIYTTMVFNQWFNDIPITYCITLQCWQEDLTPWMHALNENIHNTHSS
jgi:hypothetical protein